MICEHFRGLRVPEHLGLTYSGIGSPEDRSPNNCTFLHFQFELAKEEVKEVLNVLSQAGFATRRYKLNARLREYEKEIRPKLFPNLPLHQRPRGLLAKPPVVRKLETDYQRARRQLESREKVSRKDGMNWKPPPAQHGIYSNSLPRTARTRHRKTAKRVGIGTAVAGGAMGALPVAVPLAVITAPIWVPIGGVVGGVVLYKILK